jgi:hypothetical protein
MKYISITYYRFDLSIFRHVGHTLFSDLSQRLIQSAQKRCRHVVVTIVRLNKSRQIGH